MIYQSGIVIEYKGSKTAYLHLHVDFTGNYSNPQIKANTLDTKLTITKKGQKPHKKKKGSILTLELKVADGIRPDGNETGQVTVTVDNSSSGQTETSGPIPVAVVDTVT